MWKRSMPSADHTALWSKDEFNENFRGNRLLYSRSTLPGERSKLTACLSGKNLHIFGGRMKNGEIVRDLWHYNIETQVWYRYEANELPRFEGHAMASTERGDVYFFGGTFSRMGCPLWLWSSDSCDFQSSGGCSVKRVEVDASVPAPGSRRGHSLTYVNGFLYVYGGHIDVHGSTDSLWRFNCDSQQWVLLSINEGPEGRHGHSTVAFNGCLFVYGGLSDLHAKGDFWKFDTISQRWDSLRSLVNPGARFGHSCCVTQTLMFLFGGEDGNGNRKDDLWCYDFLKRDWSRVMYDPHCRPNAAVYCSLIALEPAHIAGNSNVFSIKKTPEYLVNSKLEAEAGECSVCRYPIVESAPNKQELIVNNSGPVGSGMYSAAYHRSPGSADSGFQDHYIRSASELGLLTNVVRTGSTDTQPYMINMAFERGSTDVDDVLHHSRTSQVSQPLDGHASQEFIDEELPGTVPEMRTTRSNSAHSSFRSHQTRTSARSSVQSHHSQAETSRQLKSSPSDLLQPSETPVPRSLKSVSPGKREGLQSHPDLPSPFRNEPWFHAMPATVLNNNTLARSLNILPDTTPAVEEIEMTQMTHFTRNGFFSDPARADGNGAMHLMANVDKEAIFGDLEGPNNGQKVGNFCMHRDGRCTQLMLIGGKSSDAQVNGPKFASESLSVWRCCVRNI